MTKRELSEESNCPLDPFNREVAVQEEARSRLRVADRTKHIQPLETGLTATVESVLDGASRLRAPGETTRNDLADQAPEGRGADTPRRE